jgi:hypothetical protein
MPKEIPSETLYRFTDNTYGGFLKELHYLEDRLILSPNLTYEFWNFIKTMRDPGKFIWVELTREETTLFYLFCWEAYKDHLADGEAIISDSPSDSDSLAH